MSKLTKSRRAFLSLNFLQKDINAQDLPVKADENPEQDNEKIKLLTADGKLVEVSKHTISQSKRFSGAKNKDILKWVEDARD